MGNCKLQIEICKLQIGEQPAGYIAALLGNFQFPFFIFHFSILLLPFTPSLYAASLEPPLVGRPTHAPFSGAVGSFHLTTRASPTELQAEDPLTFTIRFTAERQVVQPPHRPDLREIAAFAERFYIEDVASPEESPTGRQGWEFAYRLKPRSAAVQAIPSFPLVYYQPGMLPASRGYMTRWAPSIELKVRPREEVGYTELQGGKPPVGPPSTVYAFVEGESALRRQGSPALPGPVSLTLLALAPPLGCLAWFVVWRRMYPDAARQAKRRRSRAARVALRKIRAVSHAPPEHQAEGASSAVADYLRERYQFPAAEPTPAEVAAHLQRTAMPTPLIEQLSQFFKDCDAMRFRPSPAPDWLAGPAAVAVINAMEGQSCAQ